MVDINQSEAASPWDQGHSIEVLREVAAGIVATVRDFRVVPVDADGVAAEWVIADDVDNDAPVALYFHGGAYLCGTLEQYRNATVGLSRAAQVRVLSVDYRLAPEHPHPAAFEDALLAYRWVLEQPGIAPSRVLIAGDSAGASIAVGLVKDAIDAGLAVPCCIVANSPFADLALSSASLNDPSLNLSEPNKTTIEWLAKSYLQAGPAVPGESLSATDPRHSPVYRDLSGLPPLLVQTGGLDNLKDDGKRLTIQAEHCGVTVRHTEYEGSGHIWIVLQPADTDTAAFAAFAEISDFVSSYLQT